MRRLVPVLAAALLLTACGSSASGGDGAGTAFVAGDGSIVLIAPEERGPAPDLSGPTLEGGEFRLGDHLGEIVVLNVWASWCAPCRAEAPVLEAVWQEVQDDGVQFVGLDTRDTEEAALAFLEAYGPVERHFEISALKGEGTKALIFAIQDFLDAERDRIEAERLERQAAEAARLAEIEAIRAAAEAAYEEEAYAEGDEGDEGEEPDADRHEEPADEPEAHDDRRQEPRTGHRGPPPHTVCRPGVPDRKCSGGERYVETSVGDLAGRAR